MGLETGTRVIWLCFAVVVLLSGVGVAAANERPMAEAGLDQTVEQNATVYLDAGGSQDPDGTVAAYKWLITAPNGTTFAPDCIDCERAQFRATQVGTYEATVTVIDDQGASQSDTLYVEVERGDPPDVQLTGPTTLRAGENGTVTANVSEGDGALISLVWIVDGEKAGSRSINGPGSYDRPVSFSGEGQHSVQARARDVLGRSTAASTELQVTESQARSSGSSPTAAGSGIRSAGAGPGIYFNNQGEVVDVRYGGQARTNDMAFQVGGAIISGSRIERKLADGELRWSEIENTLLLAGVSKSDLFAQATEYKTNCNPQGDGPTNCKIGSTVDIEEPQGEIQYADGPSILRGTGISSPDVAEPSIGSSRDSGGSSQRESETDRTSAPVPTDTQNHGLTSTIENSADRGNTANIFDSHGEDSQPDHSFSQSSNISSIDLDQKSINEIKKTTMDDQDISGTTGNDGLTITR